VSGLPQFVGDQLALGLQREAGAVIEGDVDVRAAVAPVGPLLHPYPRNVGQGAGPAGEAVLGVDVPDRLAVVPAGRCGAGRVREVRPDQATDSAAGQQRHLRTRRGIDAAPAVEAHHRFLPPVTERPPLLQGPLADVDLGLRLKVEPHHEQIVQHGTLPSTHPNRVRRALQRALTTNRRSAELLFQVLTEREENSVAIASNESFGGWTKTFTDPRLCAAIVDRLTFGGNIIETGAESYRLASTKARAAAGQDAATG
jgi:hypothetical protein